MPGRKKRNKGKFLATRHCGRGNKKKGRGSGTRGGSGMAGMGKHKFTYVTAYEPDYFGKHGFVRHGAKTEVMPVSHLYELDSQAAKGKLEKKGGKFYFEFKGKILGTGSLATPVIVKAYAWSKIAESKIKAAGGEISKME